MFDVGFSELIVIAIVALVVIGPERLPGVARTVGHLLGRFQRYASGIKTDISREIQLDELKELGIEFQDAAQCIQHSISNEIKTIEEIADQQVQAIARDVLPSTCEIVQNTQAQSAPLANIAPSEFTVIAEHKT